MNQTTRRLLKEVHYLIPMLCGFWVAVGLFSAVSTAVPVELVVNGSFESDTAFTNWPGYAATNGGTITGWTISDPAHIGLNPVRTDRPDKNPFAGEGPAPDGMNVAFVQLANSISQTVTGLTPGRSYSLSLQYCARSGLPPSIDVSVNGTSLFARENVGAWRGGYRTLRRSFKAEGASAIVRIANTCANGDTTLLIDNVSISEGVAPAEQEAEKTVVNRLDLPDAELVAAYDRAATDNILPAVNRKVFFGYFSVCADGLGHGYGNTFPSLDGGQMTDALLWLGQVDVVKANWDFVRKTQRADGQLPMCIGPDGDGTGYFVHWAKGDPLRALAAPTYIQNADVIYRWTQDREWLLKQLPSINLAADYLASLTDADGGVRGAGYYVEMPTRIEYDGVAQGHVADAFRRVANLDELVGNQAAARRYREIADRITAHFQSRFWVKNHFAEYIHPERGIITNHGLTDSDWSAIATGLASPEQVAMLWPQLQHEEHFYYGGVPTGIATLPGTYELWETVPQGGFMERAAMGRVWYVESWARARMDDGAGLVDSLRRVAKAGRERGYCWFERYSETGQPFGCAWYCEYPANLIRIVQRFLLGVEFGLDGSLQLAPTAPSEFWDAGFGQTLMWRERSLSYRMKRDYMSGDYRGTGPQRLCVRLFEALKDKADVTINGHRTHAVSEDGKLVIVLPAAPTEKPCHFEIRIRSTQKLTR